MPHDYLYAIRTQPGDPGVVTFAKGGDPSYPDTASSKTAVLDEQQDQQSPAAQRGAPAIARFAELTDHTKVPLSVRFQWRPQAHCRAKPQKSLGACAEIGLTRDLSASSATIAALTIAAEISLRADGKLGHDEFLSVSALEELATVLTARKTVSTFYNTLKVAQQVGFLRERDVDPLTARFSGEPAQWSVRRFDLVDYVSLNDVDVAGSKFEFSPQKVDAWLLSERPALARVDPRKLVLMNTRAMLTFTAREGAPEAHQAVVIVGKEGSDYIVRTGWKEAPRAKMSAQAATEGWGMVFGADVESRKE